MIVAPTAARGSPGRHHRAANTTLKSGRPIRLRPVQPPNTSSASSPAYAGPTSTSPTTRPIAPACSRPTAHGRRATSARPTIGIGSGWLSRRPAGTRFRPPTWRPAATPCWRCTTFMKLPSWPPTMTSGRAPPRSSYISSASQATTTSKSATSTRPATAAARPTSYRPALAGRRLQPLLTPARRPRHRPLRLPRRHQASRR